MSPAIRTFLAPLFLAWWLASFSSVAQAPLDIRVALVIGNAAYQSVPALSNPVNDARAMSLVLRRLGFKVFDVIDGDRASMTEAIGRMKVELKGQQAVAMLYFAGHGLQLDWRNYMVPVDARIAKADDVARQTVDIEQVIETFKGAQTRMNIIVLDACRDNPFAGSGGGKGLAQLDAPPGTYLAFATAPGNVAEDGDTTTGNGLFTHFLLKELQRPARIEDVFKRVRLQVRQKSQGRQIPWDSSSLEDDFAFNDGQKFKFTAEDYQREVQEAKAREDRLLREAAAAAERERQLAQLREQERIKLAQAQRIAEQQAREQAEAQAREREQQLTLAAEAERKKAQAAQQALERARAEEAQRLKDLELARAQADEEARRKKLSAAAAQEQQFNQEKAEWDRIKGSQNAQDFYAFLLKYPNGLITQQAAAALERLDTAKITAQADRNGQIQRLGEPRYRVNDRYTRITRDGYSGKVIKRSTYRIHKIENGLVYAKSEEDEIISNVNGGVIQLPIPAGTVSFDPPFLSIPGDEFTVGKKWKTTFIAKVRNGAYPRNLDIKIVAYEKITIEAGTFWAYKFELQGWAGNNRVEETYWHLPNSGVRLKSIVRDFPRQGPATIHTTELSELTLGS